MKRFLYILLLAPIVLLAKSSLPAEKAPTYAAAYMWTMPWRIESSEKDPSLDKNHSRFEIRFSEMILNGTSLEARPVTIEFSCNGVIQRFNLDATMKTTVDVSPGKYVFAIATLEPASNNEIVTDSIEVLPGHKTVLSVDLYPYIPSNNNDLPGTLVFKPVIYLYPEKELLVDVKLQPKGEFTFTYPAYNQGWKGTAHPDGSITIGETLYPYLFWEGKHENLAQLEDYSTGFVVQQEEIIPFLEEKLAEMGLSDKEQTDFITFWGPRMAASEQGFAHFLFTKEYDQIGTLNIQPAPKNIFRVYLLWTPLDAKTTLHLKPQIIESVNRNGFYAIEWGGSELPLLTRQLTSK